MSCVYSCPQNSYNYNLVFVTRLWTLFLILKNYSWQQKLKINTIRSSLEHKEKINFLFDVDLIYFIGCICYVDKSSILPLGCFAYKLESHWIKPIGSVIIFKGPWSGYALRSAIIIIIMTNLYGIWVLLLEQLYPFGAVDMIISRWFTMFLDYWR